MNINMKAKYLLLLAAMTFSFIACEKQTPFDTQSPDDEPLILKPYNESGTGSFTYLLASPETPLLDSVTVTPSAYTTVNWYLDGQLVYTGTRIEMCFLAGKYDLLIEAVTDAGKRTTRTGTVTVSPNPTDPYSAAPAAGRHMVPGVTSVLEGANLAGVAEIALTSDVFGVQVVQTIVPTTATDTRLEFVLPEMADGAYYVRLKDASGLRYGADQISVHNSSVALSGFEELVPGAELVITGVGLDNVTSVTIDAVSITELVATGTTVTFTTPELEVGEHTISMKNADGSDVLFITSEGAVTQAKTIVSAETTLWTGPVSIKWDAERVKVTSEQMAVIPEGTTIYVYFEKLPENDPDYYEGSEYKYYHALRITTPWWDGYDLVAQMEMGDATSPFSFTYDADCKNKVETCGAMSLVGWGLNITKITYK